MTNLIPLPDGRVLAVDDRGPSSAPAVVFLHAAPGSRVLDPDPDATARAGVRLLTIDRPGYGQSSPPPDGTVPTLGEIADDVAHTLMSLGIGPASVVGWSAGGRVALTLAARHPSLVASVGVVGTPAPDEAVPWVPEEFRQMTPAVRADPVGALPMLAGAFAQYGASPEAAIESVSGGPADEAVLGDPARRARKSSPCWPRPFGLARWARRPTSSPSTWCRMKASSGTWPPACRHPLRSSAATRT
jgi:pimeloyl-ACP methyl ester carboxylesterase